MIKSKTQHPPHSTRTPFETSAPKQMIFLSVLPFGVLKRKRSVSSAKFENHIPLAESGEANHYSLVGSETKWTFRK